MAKATIRGAAEALYETNRAAILALRDAALEAKRAKNRVRAARWRADHPGYYKQSMAEWHARNREKVKADGKARYYANPEKYRAASAAWRAANPEANRTANEAWRNANPERLKSKRAEYHAANREKRLAQARAWREKNPERFRELWCYHTSLRRARKMALTGSHTRDEKAALLKQFGGKCAEPTCRVDLGGRPNWDHIVPVTRGGTNFISNLQPFCKSCNSRKHAKDPIAWAQMNGRLL